LIGGDELAAGNGHVSKVFAEEQGNQMLPPALERDGIFLQQHD